MGLLHCSYSLAGNGSLIISRAVLEDSGVFQCFVSNAAGEVMAATWLRITSKYLHINRHVVCRDAKFGVAASK